MQAIKVKTILSSDILLSILEVSLSISIIGLWQDLISSIRDSIIRLIRLFIIREVLTKIINGL
jgi:hypothetical protein